jgi:leucyl/phenylalanyl-tRNA--protein transferase
MAISWLGTSADSPFPPVEQATSHGLLAAGGDLSLTRLLNAYRQGIFPWFNAYDPILWWSPNPRMVFQTDNLHISKSLKKALRQKPFHITFDQDFKAVMQACAAPRQAKIPAEQHETWIHNEMIAAYTELHQAGYAHSVECWQDDQLVGGIYGVSIGKMFFGESMFSYQTNASKIALVALARQLRLWEYPLIDCQVFSDHLSRLGAMTLPRESFVQQVQKLCSLPGQSGSWQTIASPFAYEP